MSRIHASLGYVRRPGPLVAVSLAYLLLVSGVMIWRGISVSPDYLLLILVPVALLSGRFLGFLRDWVPFIALFLGYEAVRGIAPKSGIPVHYRFVISVDKALFGGTDPSQWLQAHLGSLHWLAIACTVVYFCHFVIPITVGMVLWLVDRVQFLRFTVALLAHVLRGLRRLPARTGGTAVAGGPASPAAGRALADRAAQRGEPVLQLAEPRRGGGVSLAARGLSAAGRAGALAGDPAGRGAGLHLVCGGVVQRGLPRPALRHGRHRRHRLRGGHLAGHHAARGAVRAGPAAPAC